jgi:hypothetical protein
MSDRGVKIFAQQAEQHYTRGVAAARGGQKAVAARLLRQAVRLNPQHEQAWLWLSGVLDDPADIAFCLRSVLQINPGNERAARGLQWIEQHGDQQIRSQPSSFTATPTVSDDQANWWSQWRSTQSTWVWTIRALLLIPILLIGSTLAMRALVAAQPLPTFATYRDIPVPTPQPTVPPLPTAIPTPSTPPSASDAVATYFERINAERTRLRGATEAYRTASDGGRTAVERATAARQLRDQVQRSHEQLAAVAVPPEIAAAHQLYLDGLSIELEALDYLLEYYGSYDVALANKAALQLQEARSHIATATASWDAFAEQRGVEFASINVP